MAREPFFARFVPVGGGSPFIEIRITNSHIRYSKGTSDSSVDEQTLGAIAMRQNEFNILSTALYPKISDKRYGNNRPAYTILLGDYNLNIPNTGAGSPYLLESIEITDGHGVKIITTTQRDLTTLRNPKDRSGSQQQGFSSNYDHFTYDAERFSTVTAQCQSIDSVNKYCGGDVEKHRKTVSNNIPIVMELDITKG